MNATLADADAYFAPTNHVKFPVWKRFTADQKTAALATGRRTLERILDDTLESYHDTEFPRCDYALFEQALYILENLPITNADESMMAPTAMDIDSDDKTRRATPGVMSREALNWLVVGGGVTLSRG